MQIVISNSSDKPIYEQVASQVRSLIMSGEPGKGSYVAGDNLELLREERLRQVEASLAKAVEDARLAGIGKEELHEMLDLELEEER